MNVLFRLNAGKTSGFGHFFRCLVLNEAFIKKEIKTFFLIKTDNQEMIHSFLKNENINRQNYKLLSIKLTQDEDVEIIKKSTVTIFHF